MRIFAPICNSMAILQLTKGYTAIIDDDDFEKLSKYNCHVCENGSNIYARRTVGYLGKKIIRNYLHREIINCLENEKVDHIDGNGLNCKKENLRKCNSSENNRNRISRPRSSSKYLGVSFSKSTRKKWLSQIVINGKNKNLGRFEREIDAALEYDKFAKIHHKEFANLNFK